MSQWGFVSDRRVGMLCRLCAAVRYRQEFLQRESWCQRCRCDLGMAASQQWLNLLVEQS